MDANTRILIVDDHASIREGLRCVLEEEPGLRIVGEAATGEDAVVLAGTVGPDVILMDLMFRALAASTRSAASEQRSQAAVRGANQLR